MSSMWRKINDDDDDVILIETDKVKSEKRKSSKEKGSRNKKPKIEESLDQDQDFDFLNDF